MNTIQKLSSNIKSICSNLVTKAKSETSLVSNASVVAKAVYVTIIVTESTASILNVKAVHLQDLNDNYNKSIISIPFRKPLIELLSHRYSDNSILRNLYEGRDFRNNVGYTRITQMEPSSSSVYGLDDLSEIDLGSSNDKNKNISIVLQPIPVQTQSLMIINSAAHENKLETKSDKIMVTVLDNELPVTASGWINVCRICHGGESTEDLIAPCRCKGSVALTHLSCLERWLKESSNSNCELCKHHFNIIRAPNFHGHNGNLHRSRLKNMQRALIINRVFKSWNSLIESTTNCSTVNSFKNVLDNELLM